MTITEFNPSRDLIIVESRIWGHTGDRELFLAVDTASTATVISPEIVEALGYGPRDGLAITTVRSAVGFVFEDYEVRSVLGKIRARPAVAEAISA